MQPTRGQAARRRRLAARARLALAARASFALAALVATACVLDASGLRRGGGGRDADGDGAIGPDSGGDGDADGELDGGDGGSDGDVDGDGGTPCVGEGVDCLEDGGARACVDGFYRDLGPCPLGCDADARACRLPSNVPPRLVEAGEGALDCATWTTPIVVTTDSGAITDGAGRTIRPGGSGLDATSGIAFEAVPQGPGLPELGVFSMTGLSVPAGFVVQAVGARALVLLVDGDATIDGVVDATGGPGTPGPGGGAGGAPGVAGQGGCGGASGAGHEYDHRCTSGGGGGGHFGAGGAGGDCSCGSPHDFAGGVGGAAGCGAADLVPLVGGSGGAGGTIAGAATDSVPGPGGGGGGAVQITATGLIAVRAGGGVNVGGGGGGETRSGGGAGGGAGGALLLEAPSIAVAVGAVLAANGGGGGGGDCS